MNASGRVLPRTVFKSAVGGGIIPYQGAKVDGLPKMGQVAKSAWTVRVDTDNMEGGIFTPSEYF